MGMSTSEDQRQWAQVLDRAIKPLELVVNAQLKRTGHFLHAQGLEVAISIFSNPILNHWKATQPSENSSLYSLLRPLIESIQNLDENDLSSSAFLSAWETALDVREKLENGIDDEETADEVITEMLTTLKALVLTSRLGHQGIIQLIDQRLERTNEALISGNSEVSMHLDVMTLDFSNLKSATTIPFTSLVAAVDPGVMTIQEYATVRNDAETSTKVQSRFAGQWIVAFYTEWELNYRRRLAKIHGCPPLAIKSETMHDLRLMRNDFAHHRGIASKKQRKCKKLKWFAENERMRPLQEHYQQLFEALEAERSKLVEAPPPLQVHNNQLCGNVDKELVDAFESLATKKGLHRDSALAEAVSQWCALNE